MSDEIISDDIKEKVMNGGSDYVQIKDDDGKLIITKDNPFVGRLLKHEYVDAGDPRYGNDEGKKHKLTWLTREDGEKVKKKQSTTSNWFMQQIIEAHKETDSWDMKWWFEQKGPTNTVPHVEPYAANKLSKEEPKEDKGSPQDFQAGKDPDETEEVDVDDIPF